METIYGEGKTSMIRNGARTQQHTQSRQPLQSYHSTYYKPHILIGVFAIEWSKYPAHISRVTLKTAERIQVDHRTYSRIARDFDEDAAHLSSSNIRGQSTLFSALCFLVARCRKVFRGTWGT